MKRIIILVGFLAGACGVTQAAAPPPRAAASAARDVGAAGPSPWASWAQCEKLVDHLETITFLSREPTRFRVQAPAFLARSQSPREHRARVDQCTITITRGDYRCLMAANDARTADLCQRRIGR